MSFPKRGHPNAASIHPRSLRPAGRTKPSPNDIALFKEHIKATGCPETYPLVDPSKCSDLRDAEILTEFQIDRKKRPNLDEAPCPICSPNSLKYLAGYLVWFPHENVVRAIGKECGKQIDEKWERKQRAYKEKQKQEIREDFIANELKNVPDLIAKLEAQLHRAGIQKLVWRELKSKCPGTMQYLRDGMKRGVLTVARKTNERSGATLVSSAGSTKFTEQKLGSVSGQTVANRLYQYDRRLAEPLTFLRSIDKGSDPDVTFLALCDMTIKEQKAVEKIIKNGKRTLARNSAALEDFEAFFSPKNLELITQWATDKSSSHTFTIETQNKMRRLKITSTEFGSEFIDISALKLTQSGHHQFK